MAIFDQIMAALQTAEGASAAIAIGVELALRIVPSAKPLSILYLVAGILKGSGAVCVKAGELLDKVLPQKIIPPAPPEA